MSLILSISCDDCESSEDFTLTPDQEQMDKVQVAGINAWIQSHDCDDDFDDEDDD